MSIEFNPITKKNISNALGIYNWYVLNSTATFHLEEIPQEELERMVSLGHSKYQSFVIEYDNVICGFCYLSQFRYKEAYDQSAEITLYLKQEMAGKGIGKTTLIYLEKVAKDNGINNLVAVITEGNNSSIALFEKVGYFKVGHLKNIGKKFGKVLDVVSYQKEI
ncbi:MAG: GNAT family N-acetyltransferase [Flavobacteriales bacterium]|nr:MAG: GNAT family N-acetyltransferase [Flavobacteriales bacterium]